MAKGRLKKRLPDEGGPRISAHHSSSSSTDGLQPCFSLHLMAVNSKYCLSKCTVEERAAFASRIREMSQLTWIAIKGSPRHGQGCEEIRPKQIRSPIPTEVSPDVTFMAFRCIGKAPMVGYRDGRTFHIIWIDRDFSLYRHS